MKYFSMFSGIGGFELGIHRAYVSSTERLQQRRGGRGIGKSTAYKKCVESKPFCVGFSEIDKYATSIYQRHFKEHTAYGNARDISPETIPEIDALVGGFPCQAFSIAGKRGGFKDTRGTLFFEIARIVSVKRPKLLLLENVGGLLSHDNGRTFGTIQATLSELGYICEWQVLNSKDFGVPQIRERVFIIGHLGDGSGRKIFPIQDGGEFNTEAYRQGNEVAYCLDEKERRRGTYIKESQKLPDAQRIRQADGLSVTLKGEGGGQGAKTGLYAIPVLTPARKEKRQNGRRMKTDGEPSFTLTAQDQHGVFDGYRIRRLTPKECERLQGFPDDWTKYGADDKLISDSQRYKVLGNAVTVNVIEAIWNEVIGKD